MGLGLLMEELYFSGTTRCILGTDGGCLIWVMWSLRGATHGSGVRPFPRRRKLQRSGADPSRPSDYNTKELALYDIPALVDHVRRDTGYDKIAFIGHSQGNSTMFCSLGPFAPSPVSLFPWFVYGLLISAGNGPRARRVSFALHRARTGLVRRAAHPWVPVQCSQGHALEHLAPSVR